MSRAQPLSVLLSIVISTVTPSSVSQGGGYKATRALGLQEQAEYIPDDNPLTPEKIALGKKFFWDRRWSANGAVACVTCHQPDHGWSDPRPFSITFAGQPTPRHSPTIVNRLFSDRQLWTGLRASLEDQAIHDSNRTDEMVVKNLGSVPAYQAEFRRVFGTELHPDGVAKLADLGLAKRLNDDSAQITSTSQGVELCAARARRQYSGSNSRVSMASAMMRDFLDSDDFVTSLASLNWSRVRCGVWVGSSRKLTRPTV